MPDLHKVIGRRRRNFSGCVIDRSKNVSHSSVAEATLPESALLRRFVDSGDYTDCFVTRVDTAVTFSAYVEAFYTTAVFKAERFILQWLVSRPSTDDDARAVARGEIDEFAAWRVLERAENQALLMDMRGRTCSWFMVEPNDNGCRLYFGSAIVRSEKSSSGRRMGRLYRLLLGFHLLYSRVLLRAARKKLMTMQSSAGAAT